MRTGPLQWIGGEHEFALDIGGLRALQASCDAGPEQILRRIGDGTWLVDDLYETIRLGLTDALGADAARKLTGDMFERHPLVAFRAVAQSVLLAALIGDGDDQVGKPEGTPPPPENGGSASSTETAP